MLKAAGHLDGPGRSTVLVELIKHLLYVKQQIPSIFSELKKFVHQELSCEDSAKRKRVSSEVKRASKFVDAADQLFSSLHGLFSSRDVAAVLLCFGATIINPSEVYAVSFEPAAEGATSRESDADHVSRSLLRQLIIEAPEILDRPLGVSRLSVMVLAAGGSGEAPGGFKPRPTYVPKLTAAAANRPTPLLLIDLAADEAAEREAVLERLQRPPGGDEATMVWLQADVSLTSCCPASSTTDQDDE
eukprot:TRINITY_DN12815_c0_g1_i1.p1 TRINITY_DN12815_c0_g1~~TRINITY_DN12815_c0_g1_i1.p1  ORF type:complete len:245 (+),score=62.81 TRINITY_DN12815_c0_g1_i1:108-842(+)